MNKGNYIPVEGSNSLYRDKSTGAIVNFGDAEYKSYISQKNKKMSERMELDNLRKDIDEIKSLLKEILNR